MRDIVKRMILIITMVSSLKISANLDDKYEIYTSQEKALKYFNELSQKKNQLMNYTGKQYAYAEGLLKEVHDVYRDIYGEKIILKRLPLILLIKSSQKRAFVAAPNEGQKFPYFFVLTSEFFSASREEIISNIAHELAHLYFVENIQDMKKEYRYYLSQEDITFGDSIDNNIEVENMVKLQNMYQVFSGKKTNASLRGLPLEGTLSYRMLNTIIERAPFSFSCNSIKTRAKLLFLNSYLKSSSYSEGDDSLINSVGELESYLKKCYGEIEIDFEHLYVSALGKSIADIRRAIMGMSSLEKQELARLNSLFKGSSAIDAIFSMVEFHRKQVWEFQENPLYKKIRIYTEEDEADEIAVVILRRLNISTDHFAKFMLTSSGVGSDLFCEFKDVSEPTYGPLDNYHHDNCWRSFRNYEYEKYLQHNL